MRTLAIVFALFVAVIATSCGGGNPIVGTWKVKSVNMNGQDMVAQMQTQMNEQLAQLTADTTMPDSLKQIAIAKLNEQMEQAKASMMAMSFTFNADLTYSIAGGPNTETGKWELSEDKKKLKTTNAEGRVEEVEVVTMNETTLTLKRASDGQTMEMTFERGAAAAPAAAAPAGGAAPAAN